VTAGSGASRCAPREHVVRLPDGRGLAVAEYGAADGPPLLYFHGLGGSRLEVRMAGERATRSPARILALDRPGYGRSDPLPERRIGDWPQDVLRVADALGLERFAVLGVSGGAPYALACAAHPDARLIAVGVACGMGPLDLPGAREGLVAWKRTAFRAARRAPWLARGLAIPWHRLALRDPERLIDRLSGTVPAPDRPWFRRPEFREALLDSIREALRQGLDGALDDLRLLALPWSVSPAPPGLAVHVWHGECDTVILPAMARSLAAALGVAADVREGEGHFSLLLHHLEEFVRTLTGAERPA